MQSNLVILIALFIVVLLTLAHFFKVKKKNKNIKSILKNRYPDRLYLIESDISAIKDKIKSCLTFNRGTDVKISDLIYQVSSNNGKLYLFIGDWITSESPGLGLVYIDPSQANNKFEITKYFSKAELAQNIEVNLSNISKSEYLIRSVDKQYDLGVISQVTDVICENKISYLEAFKEGYFIFNHYSGDEYSRAVYQLLNVNDEILMKFKKRGR